MERTTIKDEEEFLKHVEDCVDEYIEAVYVLDFTNERLDDLLCKLSGLDTFNKKQQNLFLDHVKTTLKEDTSFIDKVRALCSIVRLHILVDNASDNNPSLC